MWRVYDAGAYVRRLPSGNAQLEPGSIPWFYTRAFSTIAYDTIGYRHNYREPGSSHIHTSCLHLQQQLITEQRYKLRSIETDSAWLLIQYI